MVSPTTSPPMQSINLYTSGVADGLLTSLADSLRAEGRVVRLLPIEQLPAPDPQRRQALRVEREEISEDLARHRATLQAYRAGRRPADAGRENGLLYDIEALSTRLRAIYSILGEKEGGPADA